MLLNWYWKYKFKHLPSQKLLVSFHNLLKTTIFIYSGRFWMEPINTINWIIAIQLTIRIFTVKWPELKWKQRYTNEVKIKLVLRHYPNKPFIRTSHYLAIIHAKQSKNGILKIIADLWKFCFKNRILCNNCLLIIVENLNCVFFSELMNFEWIVIIHSGKTVLVYPGKDRNVWRARKDLY